MSGATRYSTTRSRYGSIKARARQFWAWGWTDVLVPRFSVLCIIVGGSLVVSLWILMALDWLLS